jgi:hypothetical protein
MPKHTKREANQVPSYKWRYAIGTTSRVPNQPGCHYLIADFDMHSIPQPFEFYIIDKAKNITRQKTKRGCHVYTDIRFSNFDLMCNKLIDLGADRSWVNIGRARGYLFLADKDLVAVPYPVERMQIHYDHKSRLVKD